MYSTNSKGPVHEPCVTTDATYNYNRANDVAVCVVAMCVATDS